MGTEIYGNTDDSSVKIECVTTKACWVVINLSNMHFKPNEDTHEFDGPDNNPTYQFGIPGEAVKKAFENLLSYTAYKDIFDKNCKPEYGCKQEDYDIGVKFMQEFVEKRCDYLSISY